MKTLKDFTKDIQAKIPEYIAKYTEGVFDGKRYENFKHEDAVALIDWNYETAKYKKPCVLVAENPYEAQIFFNYIKANDEVFLPVIYAIYCLRNGMELPKLTETPKDNKQLDSQLRSQLYSQLDSQLDSQLRSQLDSQLDSQLRSQLKTYNNDYLFTANVYSNAHMGYYKFIADQFNIDAPINVMLNSWNDLYQKSNVYSAIFSELLCVVSKYPKKVWRNANNDLHNPSGAAVEWGNSTDLTNFDGYYINGRNMPEWIFGDVTKEQFISEQNEDIKAGIYEVIESNGEGSMLEFLGAVEVDRQTFIHGDGTEEVVLYKTKELFNEEEDLNGKSPAALAWLRMSCPSTGTNYLIPSDSSFDNCVDAAKFHRPETVPSDLEYIWNSRN